MSNLDIELIFTEILPRLPIKSLIRFKCVSKSFKFEISSRKFVSLYLRNQSLSIDTNDLLVISGRRKIACYDPDYSTPTIIFEWPVGWVTVLGSCNGLLCKLNRHSADELVVLNLTTRNYKHVLVLVKDVESRRYGFAFDHENLDFKIVRVSVEHSTMVTRVYSLNFNSWRVLETPSSSDIEVHDQAGTLINNHLLHWPFWTPSLSKYRIGCFDVCKNEWTYDVLFPQYYRDDPGHTLSLVDFGVVDDWLYSSFDNQIDSCIDVWLMKEYGVQDSWVKWCSAYFPSGFRWGLAPVTFRARSGKTLLRQLESSKYFRKCPNGGDMTEVKFHEAPDFVAAEGGTMAHTCTRSLIEVPGGKLFEDDIYMY